MPGPLDHDAAWFVWLLFGFWLLLQQRLQERGPRSGQRMRARQGLRLLSGDAEMSRRAQSKQQPNGARSRQPGPLTSTGMRLLVVDDDAEVRDLLVRSLQRDGHTVSAVSTAAAARHVLSERSIEVVVLDLALPDQSGVELCAELRAAMDPVPVLMLTAHSEVSERVRSLDAGADDFLAKPFAVAELRARVRALGRRRERRWSGPRVTLQGVQVDFAARQAVKAGKRIELTAREWTILEALAEEAGDVVPRAHLLKEGWGAANDANAASLEVLIGRIRRKLGGDIIRTVRGRGYSLGAA